MPDIPGLQTTFRGKVIHKAAWDSSYDITGKRITIISNGASGQQILPNLLPKVAHIDHHLLSRVWVTPTFSNNLVAATADNPCGYQYTVGDLRKFEQEPKAYLECRWNLEASLHDNFQRTILGSEENEKLRQDCIKIMSHRLNGSKEWPGKLIPDFAPGCRGLTPTPGYLEALQDEHVTDIQDKMIFVTSKAIVTVDGEKTRG